MTGWIHGIGVWLAAALWLGAAGVAQEGAPHEEQPILYDGGAVYPHQIVQHTFAVVINESERWRILSIRTSCSCTVATVAAAEIQPGGSLSIPVIFNPGDQVGLLAASTVAVTLRTGRGSVLIPLEMQAMPQVPVVGPDRITLSAAAPTATITLRRGEHPAAWNVLQARLVSGGEMLHLDAPRLVGAIGAGAPPVWQLTVSADTAGWSGVMLGRIELECLQAGVALPYRVNLTVAVRLAGRLQATPPSALLSSIAAGTAAQAQLQLQGQGIDLTTARVATSDARCRAAIDLATGVLTLTVSGDGPAGPANGWVEVEVAASGERLRIPYIATVVVKADSVPPGAR